jgi:hypothetical protein
MSDALASDLASLSSLSRMQLAERWVTTFQIYGSTRDFFGLLQGNHGEVQGCPSDWLAAPHSHLRVSAVDGLRPHPSLVAYRREQTPPVRRSRRRSSRGWQVAMGEYATVCVHPVVAALTRLQNGQQLSRSCGSAATCFEANPRQLLPSTSHSYFQGKPLPTAVRIEGCEASAIVRIRGQAAARGQPLAAPSVVDQ